MQKNIELYIQTPFRSYIRTTASFDTESKILTVNDDKDLNGRTVDVDLSVAISVDINSIKCDVYEHKVEDKEKYAAYDVSDITLENVKINGQYLVCTYSINAGDYRRLCVGKLAAIFAVVDKRNLYVASPQPYNGEVCW